MQKFYRGISVSPLKVDSTIETISKQGMMGDEGLCKFSLPDIRGVREALPQLLEDPNLNLSKIFTAESHKSVFACADKLGAFNYALRSAQDKEKPEPLVIEFVAPLDDVCIDYRDFLETAFQSWNITETPSDALYLHQKKILETLYGRAIIPYFEKCVQSTDQQIRIALANLAIFDLEVVKSHCQNDAIIFGRHNTKFRSAFIVKAPIPANNVTQVFKITSANLEEQSPSRFRSLAGKRFGINLAQFRSTGRL